MIFQSKQIKGQGRGHSLGFPTINLIIPSDLELDDGIYAAWIVIRNKTFKGALHYGPVPTFGEKAKSLEVFLLDVTDETVPDTNDVAIEVDTVEYVRAIKDFPDTEDLMNQIADDVERVSAILK